MPRLLHPRLPAVALTVLVALTAPGCADAPAPLAPHDAEVKSAGGNQLSAQVRQQLAALRRVTARFHDFAAASAAGYGTKITDCLEDPVLGGQGFHYGNPAYIDGTVELLRPELLMYEPQPNGKLRLVGIEYIVPFTAWTAAEPPSLLGQHFHRNETFQVWALHVWLWRQNPSGLFADWNPNVSCDRA